MEKKRELLIRPARPSTSKQGKSYFFGVGIDNYKHFPSLNNAVKDAKDVAALMQEKYDLDEIILIIDQEATHDNIITELDKLKKRITPKDKLVIFYSGHGHLDSNEKGYWIPIDAERGSTANYIRNSTLRDYIEDIPSLHTLLISDACFSGSLFVRGVSRSTRAAEELEKIKSRWALCSGRHDEEVFDGKPGENSPFTGSVLKSLRQNNDPKLKVSLLADEVAELTRANYKQMPEGNPIFGVGHDGGQYIFCLKADEAADWKTCQETGTLKAYQNHLKHYPDGQYAEEALWQIARLQNTLRAYDDYLDRYLNGRYSDEAQRHSRSLQEDADWQQALRYGDLPSMRKYERKYPQGKYMQEALKRIDQLREGEAVSATPHPQKTSKAVSPPTVTPIQPPPKPKSSRLPWIIAGIAIVILIIVIWVVQNPNTGYLPETEVAFETMHHDFGELPIGEAAPFTFVFKNTGKVPLEILDLETDPITSVGGFPKKAIPPGEKGEIQVLFAVPPKMKPIQEGEMTIASEMLVFANVPYSPISLTLAAFVRGPDNGGGELETRPGLQRERVVPKIQEEDELWKKVQEENTPESYQHYIDLYPDGRFKEDAIQQQGTRMQLIMIEDDYFKEVRSKNTIEAFEAYLRQYPDGKYVKEASEEIRRLKRK